MSSMTGASRKEWEKKEELYCSAQKKMRERRQRSDRVLVLNMIVMMAGLLASVLLVAGEGVTVGKKLACFSW